MVHVCVVVNDKPALPTSRKSMAREAQRAKDFRRQLIRVLRGRLKDLESVKLISAEEIEEASKKKDTVFVLTGAREDIIQKEGS